MRMLIVAVILSLSLSPVHAGESKQTGTKFQALFLASLVSGWCTAKEQSGLTIVSPVGGTTTVPASLSEDEKNQCAYVRQGLASKCFERGNCPKYETWVRNRSMAK